MTGSVKLKVPNGWQAVCLEDIAKVRSGTGFPIDRQGRRTGQYPFIKVSDMTLQGNETHIQYANNYVDKKDVEEIKATVFEPGTVVFPKVGAAIATNKKRALAVPTIIDNNMIGVTISDISKCHARFLHAWFESIDLSTLANVSAVPSITAAHLKRSLILLPPLAEQISIATILDATYRVIEHTETVVIATKRLRDALQEKLLTGRLRVE